MKYARLQRDETKELDKIRAFKQRKCDVIINDCNILIAESEYKPFPTLYKMHHDDAEIKIIIGPFGSGKSSGLTMEIVRQACIMPKCLDGVRRSKWLIIRNTYDELKSTSLQMWEEWT